MMVELVFVIAVPEDTDPEDVEAALDSAGYTVVTWDFADRSSP